MFKFNIKRLCLVVILIQLCCQTHIEGVTFGDTSHILIFSSQINAANGDIIESGSALKSGFKIISGTVKFRSCMPVAGIIEFENNVLDLESDLKLDNTTTINSWGTIEGNGHKLEIGTSVNSWSGTPTFNNVHLSLSAYENVVTDIQTFSGVSSISGNGNILDISNGGRIKVTSGSTLYITDLVIKGIGLTKGRFDIANGAEVVFSNVTLEMQDSCSTSSGTFRFKGPGNILVKNYTWNFNTGSNVIIDGVSVWKDVVGNYLYYGDVVFADGVLTLANNGYIKFIYGGDDNGDDNGTDVENLE